MLDPDIQGRLTGLDHDHLTAIFNYMLGTDTRETDHAECPWQPTRGDGNGHFVRNKKAPGAFQGP
jgi:hypothetical protein